MELGNVGGYQEPEPERRQTAAVSTIAGVVAEQIIV